MQFELNRLKYTVFGNVRSLLKPQGTTTSYFHQLNNISESVCEFSEMLNDFMLLSPDVKLHQSNIKNLSLELMSYRFESSLLEQKVVLGSVISLCQQIRVSLYYNV